MNNIQSEINKMCRPNSTFENGHVYDCDGNCDDCDVNNCLEEIYYNG